VGDRLPTASSPARRKMIKDRLTGTLPEVQHQVLAGDAMGFYGLN
jgi:hypothetical protein